MTQTSKTDRREFLKKGLSLGLAAGGAIILGKTDFLHAREPARTIPDLVAVKNGEPDAMFKKAIALMGGMEQFVKKGQSVVVKPNIGFPRRPEIGATTNPLLVKTVIESCYQAGASKVYVFDNVVTPTSGNARNCYKLSGIEDAARAAGGIIVPVDDFGYQTVNIPGAKTLKTTEVHRLILDAGVFINVPVLKHHSSAHLSIAMKNLMGIVRNRMKYHLTGLDQCIADFCLYKKPDLNIVDAYRVLMSDGPDGPRDPKDAQVTLKKTLLLSKDIVAVDAAATRIFGKNPEDIGYIKIAHQQKTGNMNLNKLKIVTYTM
ncbi:MAG: DUF362 domain-containing protein [Smithella sp.]|nr:DUF362 domain-containing protein [Smithella sp.]MDM7987814.1 DUF362 domain-containing protein [Smithella sp.]HOU50969.1 DUF362 domain-containing protein [Smithella sp.]HQG65152.1 DUF362 domain-containing protein [Smithella sp.]HQI72429.1 DUF362 domain-containing protein [Smithella sp.]